MTEAERKAWNAAIEAAEAKARQWGHVFINDLCRDTVVDAIRSLAKPGAE